MGSGGPLRQGCRGPGERGGCISNGIPVLRTCEGLGSPVLDNIEEKSYIGLLDSLLGTLMSTVAAAKDRHHNTVQVGLRTFFAIAEKWRLTPDEAMTLLGKPGKGTYYNWKNGQVGQITHSHDLQSRISYVLGIFKALEILYQRPDMADAWVRRPNKAFGGQSALDRMLGGQMVDLAAVRDYLDSVRGGW